MVSTEWNYMHTHANMTALGSYVGAKEPKSEIGTNESNTYDK